MKMLKLVAVTAGTTLAMMGTFVVTAAPAHAQATRTWVSGVGDDVNPCSRTAPCKTFAGAISKTAAGGEINCLDPGGFGTLTITKSMTVDCAGTIGSTLNSGGINGFVINDSLSATPNTAKVILRNLSINGAGSTPGLNGVRFLTGKSLLLENVIIQNQLGGNGVSIQPTTSGALITLHNVTVANGQGGIAIQPTGNGSAKVNLEEVNVFHNLSTGLLVNSGTTTNAAGITVSLDNSDISSNLQGVSVFSGASVPATVLIDNSMISNNTNQGLQGTSGLAIVRVGNSTITGNGQGVVSSGGAAMHSFGNNQLVGNPALGGSDGAFTQVIPES